MVAFRVVLAVESAAKLEAARQLDKPLNPAKTYQNALEQLRNWAKLLGTATTQLGVSPDPDCLHQSVYPLLEHLLKQDAVFARDVGVYLRETRVKEDPLYGRAANPPTSQNEFPACSAADAD
eukprot:2154269-Amphidinium_carterae.1